MSFSTCSVCVFGLIRTIALGTAAPTDPTCTSALKVSNSPFVISILRIVSLPLSFCKELTLPPSPGSQVYSGIWSNAEVAVGVLAACLPTFAVFFQRPKSTSASGSSGLQLFATTWSRLFSFGDKSSPTTENIPLSDSSLKLDYQALSEGGNTTISGEAASIRSFVKLRRSDLESGEVLPEQQIAAPAKIIVKRELHQSSRKN